MSEQDTWLRRVQALLAKAESTEFPDEAEAFLTKAQELMARHAIDEAMLSAAGNTGSDPIETARITVVAPYATAKSNLVSVIAKANRARCVLVDTSQGATCAIVGHKSDVANIETLYAALSLHATRAMLAADVPAYDTPRRFRHAFLLSFASRIGQRLREAAQLAEQDAEAVSVSSVALVLADRGEAVDRAFTDQFPNVRQRRATVSSRAGVSSGVAAANRAPLGQRGVTGSRGALTG